MADSLALVAMYQGLDGDNWTNNDNWLVGPLNNWFGISISSERVSSVNLPDNNLSGEMTNQVKKLTECLSFNVSNNKILGEIPEQVNRMESLQTLNLSNNEITSIPDFSVISSLLVLDVSNNKLLFNSLELNTSIGAGFNYVPQDSIGEELVTLKLDVGQSFELSVETESPNNEFQWIRDGSDISGATDSLYSVDSIYRDNMGVFYCEITNPNVPGLTLTNRVRGVFAKADISGEIFISDTDFLTSGSIKITEDR